MERGLGQDLQLDEHAGSERSSGVVEDLKGPARHLRIAARGRDQDIDEGDLQREGSAAPPRRSAISRSRSSQSSRGSPDSTIRLRISQSLRPSGVRGWNSSSGRFERMEGCFLGVAMAGAILRHLRVVQVRGLLKRIVEMTPGPSLEPIPPLPLLNPQERSSQHRGPPLAGPVSWPCRAGKEHS